MSEVQVKLMDPSWEKHEVLYQSFCGLRTWMCVRLTSTGMGGLSRRLREFESFNGGDS